MLANQGPRTIQLIIGIFIGAFSIVKAVWDLSNANLFGKKPSVEDEELEVCPSSVPLKSDNHSPTDNKDEKPKNYKTSDADSLPTNSKDLEVEIEVTPEEAKIELFFHIFMLLGVMYMSMLLTNWANSTDNTDSNSDFNMGWNSVWVKIVSQWMTMALYSWTLVAPIIFKDRDFS